MMSVPCCDGGSNGGNGLSGDGHTGGHGTGEDVTLYKLDNFVLSPGAGGRGNT